MCIGPYDQAQTAADDARCLTPSSAATGGEGAKRAWAAADAGDAAAGRPVKRVKPSEAAPPARLPALSYNVTSAAMTQQAVCDALDSAHSVFSSLKGADFCQCQSVKLLALEGHCRSTCK